jgi:hypothetical protein
MESGSLIDAALELRRGIKQTYMDAPIVGRKHMLAYIYEKTGNYDIIDLMIAAGYSPQDPYSFDPTDPVINHLPGYVVKDYSNKDLQTMSSTIKVVGKTKIAPVTHARTQTRFYEFLYLDNPSKFAIISHEELMIAVRFRSNRCIRSYYKTNPEQFDRAYMIASLDNIEAFIIPNKLDYDLVNRCLLLGKLEFVEYALSAYRPDEFQKNLVAQDIEERRLASIKQKYRVTQCKNVPIEQIITKPSFTTAIYKDDEGIYCFTEESFDEIISSTTNNEFDQKFIDEVIEKKKVLDNMMNPIIVQDADILKQFDVLLRMNNKSYNWETLSKAMATNGIDVLSKELKSNEHRWKTCVVTLYEALDYDPNIVKKVMA